MADKRAFANEQVVEDYLISLLSEPVDADALQIEELPVFADDKLEDKLDEKLAAASLLLQQASLQSSAQIDTTNDIVVEDDPPQELSLLQMPNDVVEAYEQAQAQADTAEDEAKLADKDKEILPEVETEIEIPQQAAPIEPLPSLYDSLDDRFQALFFDVAGLTLAVPLIELGGIHKLESISPLVGKPAWFAGVMIKNDEKYSCVDSAQWVMPEKYSQKMAESLQYQYLVLLGKTSWGMMCERLITTVELSKDDVKWRSANGKRPWLAGMVKKKMCALIDVAQLVGMIESGLNNQK